MDDDGSGEGSQVMIIDTRILTYHATVCFCMMINALAVRCIS